jgi:phosphohistidine phosphatase
MTTRFRPSDRRSETPPECRKINCPELDYLRPESDIAEMRRLLLLRHAKTERAEPGERDRDRRLTKRGRSDAPVIGTYMAHHGFVPDLALISPAARTQETWALIAPAFAKAPRMAKDERIYNATPERLLAAIGETRGARSLLVIGHNPGLHEVALQLIAAGDVEARERVAEKLPTSGLIVIDFSVDEWSNLHPRSGRLERFVTPRLLAAATD